MVAHADDTNISSVETLAWEGRNAQVPPVFPQIRVSQPADVPITLTVRTIDGTATAPDYYVAAANASMHSSTRSAQLPRTAYRFEYFGHDAPLLAEPLEIVDSAVRVPDRPGAGIEWDKDFITFLTSN